MYIVIEKEYLYPLSINKPLVWHFTWTSSGPKWSHIRLISGNKWSTLTLIVLYVNRAYSGRYLHSPTIMDISINCSGPLRSRFLIWGLFALIQSIFINSSSGIKEVDAAGSISWEHRILFEQTSNMDLMLLRINWQRLPSCPLDVSDIMCVVYRRRMYNNRILN